MIARAKKIWCDNEDLALKKIYSQELDKNWSVIAKRLCSQFDFSRKSAKQCRQRYQNHIAIEGLKLEWTEFEQQKLVELHNQMGNKWSLIAQSIPGKNDNCIKNHFYSKLRRILRKLNTIIHSHLRKQFREINISNLYKLIEATEQRFKEQPACGFQVSVACQQVQNRMLHVAMLKEEEFDSEERLAIYISLVKDIYRVSKLYKRKSKKIRNATIQAPNTKRKKKRQTCQKNVIREEGYESDSQSVFEEQAIVLGNKPAVIIEEGTDNIKDMLKDAGILKVVDGDVDNNRSGFRFSSGSSFRSYSDRNVDSASQFFEDSDNEKGKSKHKKGFQMFRGRLFDDPSGGSQKQGLDFQLS